MIRGARRYDTRSAASAYRYTESGTEADGGLPVALHDADTQTGDKIGGSFVFIVHPSKSKLQGWRGKHDDDGYAVSDSKMKAPNARTQEGVLTHLEPRPECLASPPPPTKEIT